MFLVYKPEGADERRWTYEPEKLLSSEAEAIERKTGWTYEEFGIQLVKGSTIARRALLWVLLKRDDPTLRHEQIDIPVGVVRTDYNRTELQAIRDAAAKDTDLTDAERDGALEQLEKMLAELPEEDAPKAPESDAGSND